MLLQRSSKEKGSAGGGQENGRLVYVPSGMDAGTFVSETSESSTFNAAKGVNALFSRIKFAAYPDSKVCCHQSHEFYCRHWSVDPNDKLAADAFMRTYWSSIVRALNVRRNNSAKAIKALMKRKLRWTVQCLIVGLCVAVALLSDSFFYC